MKKTLVAMAALAATSAFAQSSVTLYGTIDASVHNINAIANGKNGTAYVDGAVSSSVWGLKGSEDLGGGQSAIFEAQGDFMSNNGGTHQAGMFRRALYVGLKDAKLGEVALGLKGNPLIAANAGLVPVGGNTVTTNTTNAVGFADFYTKNAVTYTSPAIAGGLVVTAQHGLSNSAADAASYGSVNAFSAIYTNGPLKVTAAGQARNEAAVGTAVSGANPSAAVGTAAVAADATHTAVTAATGDAFNKRTRLFGVSYALNSQLTAAVGRVSSKAATTFGGAYGEQVNATYLGLGYQLNPAVLLGANRVHAQDSTLTNLQARYSLSKRTTAYTQYTSARNNATGAKFAPVATNTGTSPAADITAMGTGTAGKTQTAIGVGIIHTF